MLGTTLEDWEFGARSRGHAARDGEKIVYDKRNGTLWFDPDDDGAGAAFHFATLANRPQNLTHNDFVTLLI